MYYIRSFNRFNIILYYDVPLHGETYYNYYLTVNYCYNILISIDVFNLLISDLESGY